MDSLRACREIPPAGAILAHDDFALQRGGFRLGFVDMVDDLGFIRADDGLDLGGVVAVNNILLHEQMRRRDDHRTDLVQRQNADPEFIMPL